MIYSAFIFVVRPLRFSFILHKATSHTLYYLHRPSDSVRAPVKDEDEDVAQERERISRGGNKNDILLIRDLLKVSDGDYFVR